MPRTVYFGWICNCICVSFSVFRNQDVCDLVSHELKMTTPTKNPTDTPPNIMKDPLQSRQNSTQCEISSNETVDVEGSVPFLGKPQLLDSIMCRQIVGPRCKLGLRFRVTRTNQELRWRFRALKGKMSFAIYRQKLELQQSDDDDSVSLASCDNQSLDSIRSVSKKISSKKNLTSSLDIQSLMSQCRGMHHKSTILQNSDTISVL